MITRRVLLASAAFGAAAIILDGSLVGRAAIAAGSAKPPIALFKNPGCGCCEEYAAYLRQHGFTITVRETDKLADMSTKAGIPAELEGCHIAFFGGYVVSGHVPIEAIDKLLAERPQFKGLALPGMPLGSPGMSGAKQEPFKVYAFGPDSKAELYMTI
jgi:hypothetical protein